MLFRSTLEAARDVLNALAYLSGALYTIGKSFNEFADNVIKTGIFGAPPNDESPGSDE